MDTLAGTAAYLVFFLAVALNYAIVCLGLNLQWGFTGLFNVGVAGFFAIGAYAGAILTAPEAADRLGGFGLPWPIGWLAGLLVSGLAGLLIGAPVLRLRHDYLAITTFGIAVTIQLVALNLDWLTGGAFGLSFIPRPFYQTVGPGGFNLVFLALTLSVLAAVWWAVDRLTGSPWGRVLRAIREDEAAARSLGKSAALFRLQSFAMGCAVMGLAGAMYASFVGFIAPQDFLPIYTFQVWTMLIVGGSGNNRGVVLGAALVWAIWTASGRVLTEILPSALQIRGAALQIVLIGVLLAALLVLRPRGLLGERAAVSRHLTAVGRRRR